ncbi:MAG: ATP-binding protein [Limisphaerales bacterium]
MKLFSRRTRIHVHLRAFAGVEQLNGNQRTILYRVAQEALNNVARHAHASQVEVSILKHAGGICMKVSDDGKSFDLEYVMKTKGRKTPGTSRHAGAGWRLVRRHLLRRIRPRAKGTTIVVEIPLGKIRLDDVKISDKTNLLKYL